MSPLVKFKGVQYRSVDCHSIPTKARRKRRVQEKEARAGGRSPSRFPLLSQPRGSSSTEPPATPALLQLQPPRRLNLPHSATSPVRATYHQAELKASSSS
ncbi:hypothetical protein KFK09_017223 [Dendrobium nobile]|uniref:Uncharacterized protein n=1 Tax=Dendrobium nobile TaxID=94219 RepID=A0A8T3B0F0_DENNO|nr:hypothetical protein KFK09_017223 [Dendrobium nobile]